MLRDMKWFREPKWVLEFEKVPTELNRWTDRGERRARALQHFGKLPVTASTRSAKLLKLTWLFRNGSPIKQSHYLTFFHSSELRYMKSNPAGIYFLRELPIFYTRVAIASQEDLLFFNGPMLSLGIETHFIVRYSSSQETNLYQFVFPVFGRRSRMNDR